MLPARELVPADEVLVRRVVRGGRFGGQDAVELDDAGHRGVVCREIHESPQRHLTVLAAEGNALERVLVAPIEHGGQQRALVREVVQQPCLAHADLAGDVPQRA